MKTLKFVLILLVAGLLLASCDDSSTNPIQVATPVISPGSGTYNTNQTVEITCATIGATIHYTLDGSTPDTTSTVYTAPFVVSDSTTVKAFAVKDGSDDSAVATADIVINYDECAAPVITPAGGTYPSAQNITITTTTPQATIKYTIDGTDPTNNSTTYVAPFQLSHNATIKAIAQKEQMDPSPITSESYEIYANMISIPAGTFTMGSPNGVGDDDEHPAHSITLSPFYMGKYEVTQAEWRDVMGTNPSNFAGDDRPVEMVSFYQVMVYCNKRSIQENLTPVYTINGSTDPSDWGTIPNTNDPTWNQAIMNMNVNGYRLPTEAEWEYAARANEDYTYSGSNNLADVAWYDSNSGNTTHNVGGKAANAWGFYDMTGNVREWTWDWYSDTYYASSPTNNPTGPAMNINNPYHSIRGGSYDNQANACRVAFRTWGTPDKNEPKVKLPELGFRVVRK